MRKNIRLFVFFAFTALILTACTTTEKEAVIDMKKLRVEIQAMEDAYAAGEKAKDADAVAAYYSDDAIRYSRNNLFQVKQPSETILQIIWQKIQLKITMYIRL